MATTTLAPTARPAKKATDKRPAETRFYGLDGLRGVGAMTIVILHYRGLSDKWIDNNTSINPYFHQIAALWKYGWLAVDFFFLLSGFIFFWKYGKAVSEKAITLTNFALLRLTRLYPLHLCALASMGVAQLLYYNATRTTFIYGNNNLYHLILQLTFLNYGWIETGHSWNASAWTIALEMAMYFIFYAVCFGRQNRTLISLGLFLVAIQFWVKGPVANVPFLNEPFLRAGVSFFLGGTILYFYEALRLNPKIAAIVGAAMLGFVVVLLGLTQLIALGDVSLISVTGPRLNADWMIGGFPCLLLGCLLFRPASQLFGSAPFRYLGDISYSVYMLHLPVEVLFGWFSIRLWQLDFLNKGVFWTYVAVVMILSTLSHYYFEKPVMRALRRRYLTKPATASARVK